MLNNCTQSLVKVDGKKRIDLSCEALNFGWL